MPIFDYHCANCGHDQEILQKVNETPILTCPKCNQDTLEKGFSAPRFRLSGSGWYETDEKPKSKQRHLASKDSQVSAADSSAPKKQENKQKTQSSE